MYKLCLVLMCFVFSGPVMAQRNTIVEEEPNCVSSSINIAVSGADEADGDFYFGEGEKNEKSGDFNGAVNFFGKAAFEYNSSRNFSRYGSSLLRLSNVHYLLAHYTEAEQVILNVALKSYSRFGNRTGQLASYSQLGKIYLAANKLTQSMWFYTQQGILAKQVSNNTAYIDSILGLVQVKIKKKEYALAAKDLNRAELFAKTSKINQFKGQIKQARSSIEGKRAL